MNDQQIQDAREDTMLYRKPTEDSDDNAVQDIWGEKLEVRTVDASEVPDLLAEGWVTHPLELGGSEKKQKPEQAAGFEPVKGESLQAAEKLADELTKERDKLLGEIRDLTAERDMLKDAVAEANQKTATAVAERDKALEDLKAAEDLMGAADGGKPKLGVKKEGQS